MQFELVKIGRMFLLRAGNEATEYLIPNSAMTLPASLVEAYFVEGGGNPSVHNGDEYI